MFTACTYLTVVFLVGVVSSSWLVRPVDFRRIATPRIITDQQCTAPGLMCKNCTTIQSCVSIGSTTSPAFIATDVQFCDVSMQCLNGNCVPETEANPFCQAQYDTFTCPDYGVFPDPVYCQKFHICAPHSSGCAPPNGADPDLPFTDIPKDCETGYGYNARTKVCDKKLVNNQCPLTWPVPLCKTAAQTAPLQENPSIYYICRNVGTAAAPILYPTMYQCKNGKVYNSKWGCQ